MKQEMKSDPTKTPGQKNVTLRIPDDLHREVVALSEAKRRSIHAQILWAIEQNIEQERAAA